MPSSAILSHRGDLADVLHDLGQPLAAIRALASAPLPGAGQAERPDEARERLRRIRELGDWMNELLSSGRQAVPEGAETSDVVDVVEDVVLTAGASFAGLLRWSPSGTAVVRVPPAQLRRAVGNVVDNATRAAGPQGWVHVRVRRVGGRTWVQVEDSGPGLGKVPVQTSRGLAVTRAVLDRCGGTLDIGSGRSGGARVRITLPSAPDPAV
jgi:signal transduction histidine kinase